MQLNLGNICSLTLLLLLGSLGVALSEPRDRTPIFDTRPSPYNPNPPRGGYGGPVF
ncbi:hypothetical protein KR093_003989 [Drosophila rubida]|uniref:Metchnikowin n=1 Tax=Drosophila rubida TaxID=30044 RepID=A0AAD4JZ25_9MUSC|nr:hypothetical protein KR093_003989 [Drosophila rubida]